MTTRWLAPLLAIVLLVAGVTMIGVWAVRAVAAGLGPDTSAAPIVGAGAGAGAGTPGAGAHRTPAPLPPPTTPPYVAHRLQAGETLISDQQISDYYLAQSPDVIGDLANTRLAIREGQIEVRCMAAEGWWYDPRYPSGLAQGSPEELAFDGRTGGGDAYRWQDAGCYGLAVHETGATS